MEKIPNRVVSRETGYAFLRGAQEVAKARKARAEMRAAESAFTEQEIREDLREEIASMSKSRKVARGGQRPIYR